MLSSLAIGNITYETLSQLLQKLPEEGLKKRSIWYVFFQLGLAIIGFMDYDINALGVGVGLCFISLILNLVESTLLS